MYHYVCSVFLAISDFEPCLSIIRLRRYLTSSVKVWHVPRFILSWPGQLYSKLTSIVEKATVSLGNESSTVLLVLVALCLLQEIAVPRTYIYKNLVLYICLHCSSYSQFLRAICATFCSIVLISTCSFSGISSLPKSNQTKRA